MKIPHNLPVRARRPRWFLSHLRTNTEFVFVNPASFGKAVRTAADGWTRADAESFNQNLTCPPLLRPL